MNEQRNSRPTESSNGIMIFINQKEEVEVFVQGFTDMNQIGYSISQNNELGNMLKVTRNDHERQVLKQR